jgi:hypothetical protein
MSDLPVGTKIKFIMDLVEHGIGRNRRTIIYARQNDLGVITGHGTKEGYWVQSNTYPSDFGARREEFEISNE